MNLRFRTLLLLGLACAVVVGAAMFGRQVFDAPVRETNVSADESSSQKQAHKRATVELTEVERTVRVGFADVAHMSSARFAKMRERDPELVIFDVREADEFRVSRIPGSVRVDPGTWSASFLSDLTQNVSGKTVVFYCSVGVRSSKLAGRVQAGLKAAGARAVYNLEGGIFRWHNEGRLLENGAGATHLVHKYDQHWGRLLGRQELAVIEPPG